MDKKVRNQKAQEYIDTLREDKNLQEFIRRLKFWRKKKGFTQMDLSYACSFGKNRIQEIESVFTSAKVSDIFKICEVLEIPAFILFTDDETLIQQAIAEYNISKQN